MEFQLFKVKLCRFHVYLHSLSARGKGLMLLLRLVEKFAVCILRRSTGDGGDLQNSEKYL